MRNVNIFLRFIVILLVIGFLTQCDKPKMFNDTMVFENDQIQHRMELLFGKQTTKLDKTAVRYLEDLKGQIAESIEKVDGLESDGSDEAEDLRDAFLDLFEFYESAADGVLRQVAEHYDQKRGDRFYSESDIDAMLRGFEQREKELYDEINRAQKAYAKKQDAELVEHQPRF